ncbi:hypothetical protein BT69DRAFT_1357265, partial [Atractiella rhizophila]
MECHFCGSPHSLSTSTSTSRNNSPLSTLLRSSNGKKGKGREGYTFKCLDCEAWNWWDAEKGEWSDWREEWARGLGGASTSYAQPTPSLSPSSTPVDPPFCKDCLSNQSLQLYLLSNFASNNEAEVSAYRETLNHRYPILCASCAPKIEEIVKRRDYKVRAMYLNSRLGERRRQLPNSSTTTNHEKGKEKEEHHDYRDGRSVWTWRVKGALWGVTIFHGWCWKGEYMPWITVWFLLSFVWSFWDPHWRKACNLKKAHCKVDRLGLPQWKISQAIVFGLRLSELMFYLAVGYDIRLKLVSLCIAILGLSYGYWNLRLSSQIPVKVHLSHRPRVATPVPLNPDDLQERSVLDPLASLSLSTADASPLTISAQQRQPIFGEASTPTSTLIGQPDDSPAPEGDMDWQPTYQEPSTRRKSNSFVPGPQRFWPPEKPTGLESLFGNSLQLLEGSSSSPRSSTSTPLLDTPAHDVLIRGPTTTTDASGRNRQPSSILQLACDVIGLALLSNHIFTSNLPFFAIMCMIAGLALWDDLNQPWRMSLSHVGRRLRLFLLMGGLFVPVISFNFETSMQSS